MPPRARVMDSVPTMPPRARVLDSVPTMPPRARVLDSVPTMPPRARVLDSVPTMPPRARVLDSVPTMPPRLMDSVPHHAAAPDQSTKEDLRMYRRKMMVTAAAMFAFGVAFAAQPTSLRADWGQSALRPGSPGSRHEQSMSAYEPNHCGAESRRAASPGRFKSGFRDNGASTWLRALNSSGHAR